MGGEAALYFNPEDPDQMSVVIERVLNDPGVHEELVAQGQKRVKEFTWEKCARETLDIFENVIDSD